MESSNPEFGPVSGTRLGLQAGAGLQRGRARGSPSLHCWVSAGIVPQALTQPSRPKMVFPKIPYTENLVFSLRKTVVPALFFC